MKPSIKRSVILFSLGGLSSAQAFVSVSLKPGWAFGCPSRIALNSAEAPAIHSEGSCRSKTEMGSTITDEVATTCTSDDAAQTKPPKMKKMPSVRKSVKSSSTKEGIFSPVVLAAKQVIGDDFLNEIRGKAISMHSDVIRTFVETSKTDFGQAVLVKLFDVADANSDGKLQKEELASALKGMGFSWLQEKQIEKIVERADSDNDGMVDLEEFAVEAPKTLKTNLVKLAKKNGSDMGLLV